MIAEYAAMYAELVMSLGKGGVSIFWDHVPDTDNFVMCFFDCRTWELAESSSLKVDQFGCEVYSRSKSSRESRDKIVEWHRGIMGFSGLMTDESGKNNVRVTFVDVDMNPHSFGRDEKNRSVYTARYRFRVESCGDSFRL